jgi:hypothetical protein
MKHIRYLHGAWLLLLAAVLLVGLAITPAGATNKSTRNVPQGQNSTPINATIYIAKSTLEPMFQSRIDQQVPGAVNTAIANMVSRLPRQDQGWAQQMATTLIQPSASLVSFVPQQGGIAATILLSLYPGDPKAISANLLFSFSVADSSTVQVTAIPMRGSPALASGPVLTFRIPVGQLNSVRTTPTCGDAALALNLQVPISLGSASSSIQVQQAAMISSSSASLPSTPLRTSLTALTAQHSSNSMNSSNVGARSIAPSSTTSYIEIPASSLAAVGSSIGSLPISSSFTAENIQISVQGSKLDVTSDVYWSGLNIGTADTLVVPTAANGSLAVRVLSTTLHVLFFDVPYNTYNQQIQQTLNSKLGHAFAGKFYATQAAIGANSHVPCAAKSSLILTGVTNIGG